MAKKTGLTEIDANIVSVARNAKDLNTLIHVTAMMIINHAKEHGDCSRAQKLLFALPASMRRTMLEQWFHTYTPIVVRHKEPTWNSALRKPTDKKYVEWNIEGADAEPFYQLAEATPEATVKTFAELVKMFEALGKRIDKMIEKGEVVEDDMLSAQSMALQIQGMTFAKVPTPDADNDEGERKQQD